jgi:Sec7-like guanine-nucleotide exchange factor
MRGAIYRAPVSTVGIEIQWAAPFVRAQIFRAASVLFLTSIFFIIL